MLEPAGVDHEQEATNWRQRAARVSLSTPNTVGQVYNFVASSQRELRPRGFSTRKPTESVA
jgi:hypothetical protein